ncbi:hypothetical protein VTO42DRAFT_4923 [Malbranchea cinnamomea]
MVGAGDNATSSTAVTRASTGGKRKKHHDFSNRDPKPRVTKRLKIENETGTVTQTQKPGAEEGGEGVQHKGDVRQLQERVVESVNALPLDEFVTRYVPRRMLDALKVRIEALGSGVLSNGATAGNSSSSATTTCPGISYSPAIYSSSTIPARDFDACFDLIRQTSADAYRTSSLGWSPRKKRAEMRLDDMRYLLLVREDSEPEADSRLEVEAGVAGGDGGRDRTVSGRGDDGVGKENEKWQGTERCDASLPLLGGFLSFMTTYEDDLPVLYCYELHLHPSLQSRGIGSRLMRVFESIARKIGGLEKTMLTVFRSNEAGRRFYERLGYSVDEFSPPPRRLRGGVVRECDYLILSKAVAGDDEDDDMGSKHIR